MPIVFSNPSLASGGFGTSPRSYTIGTPPTLGNRLVLDLMFFGGNPTTATVSDDIGTVYDALPEWTDQNGAIHYGFCSRELAGVPTTLFYSWTGGEASNLPSARLIEMAGASSVNPPLGGSTVSVTGFGTTETLNYITDVADEGVFGTFMKGSGVPLTIVQPGYTFFPSGTTDREMIYKDSAGPAGEYTLTVNWAGGDNATLHVHTFEPAIVASGGPSPNRLSLRMGIGF